jgi:HK97 family phage major capsid protein
VPTYRERLETLVKEMKTFCAQADNRPGGPSNADHVQAKAMSDEVTMLITKIKADHGQQFVDQLSGVADTPINKAFLSNLAAPASDGWSGPSGYTDRKTGPWGAEMKGFLDRVGSKTITPSGSITVPSISRTIVSGNDRPRNLLALIPFQKLEGTNSFSYLRETVRTHAASTVEAASLKPTSVYSVVKVEDRVRVIATLSEPVDRSLLMDVALLQQYLEGAMKEGVMLELEDQVINGATSTTGVLDDMTGILASSPTAQVFGTDKLTTARKALTTLQAQNLDPSGFAWAMAPSEWESLELLTSSSEYVMGDPGRSGSSLPIDQARMSLWGVPVVTSSVIPTGFALLGDWKGSAVIYEREGVRVDWSDAVTAGGATGFETNTLVFRAEGRWGLAVTRPAGFVYADLVA